MDVMSDTIFGKTLEVYVGSPTVEKITVAMLFRPESTGKEIRTVRLEVTSTFEDRYVNGGFEMLVPRVYHRAALRGETQAYVTWIDDRIYNLLVGLGVIRGEKRLSYTALTRRE